MTYIPGGTGGGISWGIISTDTNAEVDNGYLIDAYGGNVTLTLPAAPQEGDIIGTCDFYNQSTTNVITIARNGNNIEGDATDLVFDVDGAGITLVYTDATRGWEIVNEIATFPNDNWKSEEITSENITGTDTALTQTLSEVPSDATAVMLFLNGQRMTYGVGNDFTISGDIITWLANTGTAPNMLVTDVVHVYYGYVGAIPNMGLTAGLIKPQPTYLTPAAPVGGIAATICWNFTYTDVTALIDSATSIPDLSGNGYTFGILSGAAHLGVVDGLPGIYFDAASFGAQDSAVSKLPFQFDRAFTAYFRAKHHNVPGTSDNLFGCYATGSSLATNCLYQLISGSTDIDILATYVEWDATAIDVYTDTNIRSELDGGLCCLVREADGLTYRFYQDAVLLGTWVASHVAEGLGPAEGSQNIYIGNSGLRASIADWGVWGEAHTLAQVTEITNRTYGL